MTTRRDTHGQRTNSRGAKKRSVSKLPRLVQTRTSHTPKSEDNCLPNQRQDVCVLPSAKKRHDLKVKRFPRSIEPVQSERPIRHRMSLLDEQVLILYSSAMIRRRQDRCEGYHEGAFANEQDPDVKHMVDEYGYEAHHAATMIQKVVRGRQCRQRVDAFDGPRNQRAARLVQYAFRRTIILHNILSRLRKKRARHATRIQAWYRGCRCRDKLLYERSRRTNTAIATIQVHFRGLKFWRIVRAALEKKRVDSACTIQRIYRGHRGRKRVGALRKEMLFFANELKRKSEYHRCTHRCERCNLSLCNEGSLFDCFMIRFIGLHDFPGATRLAQDGLQMFPHSPLFHLFYSILLQVLCVDLEVAMAHLQVATRNISHRAKDLDQIEKEYFMSALLLRRNDAVGFMDMAVFLQSVGELSRAEVNYRHALAKYPPEYQIPGYWNRVNMVDRLLLNYHRFCSIFNCRKAHVASQKVSVSKRGPKVHLSIAKQNHYTVISPLDSVDAGRLNSIYIRDDEIAVLLAQLDHDPNKLSTYGGLQSWRQSSFRPQRRATKKMTDKGNNFTVIKTSEFKGVVVQEYQSEFIGLNTKPQKISSFSETKSRIKVSREAGERLLRELTFLDPVEVVSFKTIQSTVPSDSSPDRSLNIAILPELLRIRQNRRLEMNRTFSVVNIQRVYRGFVIRAGNLRDRRLRDIHQAQVEQVLATLQRNSEIRTHRRRSAILIQKIFRGYALRFSLYKNRLAAMLIQRVYRGFKGRRRARAFRDGTCTFYMAERVFHRGVDVCGKLIILTVEKCGLSFRLQGVDMEECVVYQGFISSESTHNLVHFLNWEYGKSLVGREAHVSGRKVFIKECMGIDQKTSTCLLKCATEQNEELQISLVDCISAINLRLMSVGDEPLPPSCSTSDSARIVEGIARYLQIVDSQVPPVTKMNSVHFVKKVLALKPPPKMHFLSQPLHDKHRKLTSRNAGEQGSNMSNRLLRLAFPVAGGYRGLSVGADGYRKKCSVHSVNFTRCRCAMPFVPTPPYVEALAKALHGAPEASESSGVSSIPLQQ